MKGNPCVVATNNVYDVVKRGSRYAVLKKGEPLSRVSKWRGKSVLHSMLIKGGYTRVDNEPFTVEEKWTTKYANKTDTIVTNGTHFRLVENYGLKDAKVRKVSRTQIPEVVKIGGFEECESEDEVSKALDTSKLVKKKVPVKGDNGKVHMAYRWVKPGQSVGTTSRTSKSPTEGLLSSGETYADVDKKNVQYDIIDPEVAPEPNYDDGEDFDLDAWKESKQVDYSTDDSEMVSYDLNDLLGGDDPYSRIQEVITAEIRSQEKRHVQKSEDLIDRFDNATTMSGFDDPELSGYRELLREYVCTDEDFFDWENRNSSILDKISLCTEAYWGIIKDRTLSDIDSSPQTDRFVKNVQRGVLDKGTNLNRKFINIGTDPKVLKHALILSLGEETYGEMREFMSGANLTINLPSEHVSNVMKSGYAGATFENLVHQETKDSNIAQKAMDIINTAGELDDFEDSMSYIKKHMEDAPMLGWGNVLERARAENSVIGLDLADRRPCYIAFNPDGSTEGGAPEFGDGGCIEVSDSVLAHCTLSPTDNFNTRECISRIHSVDHLKDLFLLKTLIQDGDNPQEFRDITLGDKQGWMKYNKYNGEIPLEIQYHNPVIPADSLTVITGHKTRESRYK